MLPKLHTKFSLLVIFHNVALMLMAEGKLRPGSYLSCGLLVKERIFNFQESWINRKSVNAIWHKNLKNCHLFYC